MTKSAPQRRLLNEKQAAEYLGLSPITVGIWRREGKLPHIRLGERSVRYDQAELDAFVARCRVQAEESAR